MSRVVSFSGAVTSLSCIPGFRATPVSSFIPLPRSLRTLFGDFCRRSSGFTVVVSCPCFAFFSCSSCYYFSLSSFAFVSPRFLSQTFSEGALSFFVFSLLVRLPPPLLLLLGVLRLILLLPLLPFGLLACWVSRLSELRVMLFSLLSFRLLLGLLLMSSLHFLYGDTVLLFRCFSFRACFV